MVGDAWWKDKYLWRDPPPLFPHTEGICMDIYGYLWVSIGVCVCLWKSMDVYGSLWGFKEVYGGSGKSMDRYK